MAQHDHEHGAWHPHSDLHERITIDPAAEGAQGMYHLMNAAVAPRPVAWVSTISPEGLPNLAPHSYTTIFGTDPPIIGFVSVGRRRKDSLNNCDTTREFVLNIAGLDLIDRLNLTAADFPPDEDEFSWAGLTHVASDLVQPPRVGEAPVSFEMRVTDIHPISNCYLILGEVLRVHVATSVWVDGRIDVERLNPILRLAGSEYARIGELFKLERPTYRGIVERQGRASHATDAGTGGPA
jgi:flavin reductase (DIM6/NTAB) family NADH-FMN oxidoreductase RutF